MGQYFKCITKDENGILKYSMQKEGFNYYDFSSENYRSRIGLKITEHSFLGNDLTNAVSHNLYHHPMRVVWIGDESREQKYEETKFVNPDFSVPEEDYESFLNVLLNDDEGNEYGFSTEKGEFDYKHKYLINHTKKEFLDFDDYIKKSKAILETKGWITYPVSLLTAIGNGIGLGDYDGSYMELVGYWAYDLISIEDSIPSDEYEELDVLFVENGWFND